MTSYFIVLQLEIVKKRRQNHLAADNGHIFLILMRFLITLRSRLFELLQINIVFALPSVAVNLVNWEYGTYKFFSIQNNIALYIILFEFGHLIYYINQ